MTEAAFAPVDKPTELQCGRCGQVVYKATKWDYDRQALRDAVDSHELVCPARPRGGN